MGVSTRCHAQAMRRSKVQLPAGQRFRYCPACWTDMAAEVAMGHSHRRGAPRRSLLIALVTVAAHVAGSRAAAAQEADPLPTKADSLKFPNTTAGEFTPSAGYQIIKTDAGSLNVSVYGFFRYMNQMPAGQTYTDHLGRVREVNPRNDLNWHRTFVWFTGFFGDPKFRYNITAWGLGTTQQVLMFG